ncbi:MAG: hypothetical protein WA705_05925 [Candidatus Ozemobacteraceae bacterium]
MAIASPRTLQGLRVGQTARTKSPDKQLGQKPGQTAGQRQDKNACFQTVGILRDG